ncbi:MAG: type 1 glutamine amidotransferase [Gammaproteobacteria bacterium]
MKPIRIFRHVDCEGPGFLTGFLDENAIPWELVAIDEGAPVNKRTDDISGLVFMGGPMSVNDHLPWAEEEISLIRKAEKQDIPMLGHCLGGQLLSTAMGCDVYRNPRPEIGWHPIEKTEDEDLPDWLRPLPEVSEVFHWHGETFDLPPGGVHLFRSAACENQAWMRRSVLALQFHVEMTADMVREWAGRYADELDPDQPWVQSPAQMLAGIETRIAGSQAVARTLYGWWISRLPRN